MTRRLGDAPRRCGSAVQDGTVLDRPPRNASTLKDMPTQTRNIVVLAVLEGVVMMGAIFRMMLSEAGIDLSKQPTLIWFVGVMLLAGLGVSQYVVRSSLLAPRIRAGDRVDDELKQVLGVSVAIIALAGLFVAAGPGLVARFVP